MTVRELIERLSVFDGDLEALTDHDVGACVIVDVRLEEVPPYAVDGAPPVMGVVIV